uniref:Uncharacterized protein n=1 Tax=Anthoceros angustus TaxID=48387 RepID=A0A2P1L4X2_ANTAG|nr:hypothetical protein AnanMp54 [Anthoceros angustus]AVP12857.1 hypothetical protein AnanMp54 [Anthoceros angustus]
MKDAAADGFDTEGTGSRPAPNWAETLGSGRGLPGSFLKSPGTVRKKQAWDGSSRFLGFQCLTKLLERPRIVLGKEVVLNRFRLFRVLWTGPVRSCVAGLSAYARSLRAAC